MSNFINLQFFVNMFLKQDMTAAKLVQWLQSCIDYQATIISGKQSNVYFGPCSTTIKARFNNHTSSFRCWSKASSTELSKHIWKLKDSNHPYNITWNEVKHTTLFHSGAKAFGLCLAGNNAGKTWTAAK